jgi:hypothetical protein
MTKTIKCRIALAVDRKGGWSAAGWNIDKEPATWDKFDHILDGVDEGEVRYWIEVEVPVPAAAVATLPGEVKPA